MERKQNFTIRDMIEVLDDKTINGLITWKRIKKKTAAECVLCAGAIALEFHYVFSSCGFYVFFFLLFCIQSELQLI